MEFQHNGKKWQLRTDGLYRQVPAEGGPKTGGVTFTDESGNEYCGALPVSSDTWTDDVLSNALESAIRGTKSEHNQINN